MVNLNLQDILDMFQNGERRYAEDPAFKAAIDSLKMGLGVYAVLDHTLRDKSLANAKVFELRELLNKRCTENLELSSVIEQLRSGKPNLMQVLITREVYPNELQDLRDYKTRTTDQIQNLKDEVASWEDRYDALEQGENL